MKNNPILARILQKLEIEKPDNFMNSLSQKISQSDLNTFLLALYAKLTARKTPAELLKLYEENSYVKPSPISPILLYKQELKLLNMATEQDILPVQLSPAAQLGSCSVIATVSQNKIFSAVRGTEILADPTNMLALHISREIKYNGLSNEIPIHFCATSRVIRGQKFLRKDLVQHFSLYGMVSSGRDRGSYSFESQCLVKHIGFYRDFFVLNFGAPISLTLHKRGGYTDSEGFIKRMQKILQAEFPDTKILVEDNEDSNAYYTGLQFTLYVHINGKAINNGDGGFVNWIQNMLGNKKERLLISAIGIDRLCQPNQ